MKDFVTLHGIINLAVWSKNSSNLEESEKFKYFNADELIDGDEIDILVQARPDQEGAERFFCRLLKGEGSEPRRLVTDQLRSYAAAHRTVMPGVLHDNRQYANNRAEGSHQPTRQRERYMRRFKSPTQAQRFLTMHGLTRNLFRVGRHLLQAVNHRILRARSFLVWSAVAYA